MITTKIKFSMVGGGIGSMIGPIHRYAARLDNLYEMMGGVFSTSYEKSLKLANELNLTRERIHTDYKALIKDELSLPEKDRVNVIVVATPNNLHYEIAKLVLQSGFHLIIEKPLTCTHAESLELIEIAKEQERYACVMFTYVGYPMIKEGRSRIACKQLGKIKHVALNFTQGFLNRYIEDQNKQAKWRQSSKQSGLSGTLADIGVHAFHLAEYMTGLKISEVLAKLSTHVSERQLDDAATVLLKFNNGATGILNVSQISSGDKANLSIQVDGEDASLRWQHDRCNELKISYPDHPTETFYSGYDNQYLKPSTIKNCRTPAGHPEGYLEAFANHYRNFAESLKNENRYNLKQHAQLHDYPSLYEGARGMAFIESAVGSSAKKNKWNEISECGVYA